MLLKSYRYISSPEKNVLFTCKFPWKSVFLQKHIFRNHFLKNHFICHRRQLMAFYYTFIGPHCSMLALKEPPLSEADCRMMLPDEVLKCQPE